MVVTEKRRDPVEKESIKPVPKRIPAIKPERLISKRTDSETLKRKDRKAVTKTAIVTIGPLPRSNSRGCILALAAPMMRSSADKRLPGPEIKGVIEIKKKPNSLIPAGNLWRNVLPGLYA
jgi:hypothetical protein